MDGIEELAGVTVVAATNRPDVLDGALMRPGRLDRILFVGAPDATTRRDIFRICLARMAVEEGVDVEQLAMIVCHSQPSRSSAPEHDHSSPARGVGRVIRKADR